MKKATFVIIFSFILIVGLFSQVTDAQIRQSATTLGVPFDALKQFVQSYQTQTVPSGAIEISARQLIEAYQGNQLQADMTYKNKDLKVTGVVVGVKKDLWDAYYVEIEGTSSFATVDVYVNSSELNKIASLKKGQRVVVIGKCEGFNVISVEIKNATIQIVN